MREGGGDGQGAGATSGGAGGLAARRAAAEERPPSSALAACRGSAAAGRRGAPSHSGSQALAESDAPARPGKEEGGAALSARTPPTTQAAGISGPGARHSAPLRRAREAPRGSPPASGRVTPRHGAPNLGLRKGETSWIDRRRARRSPPVLRVERSRRFPFSLPHSKKAAGGFPRAFPPARWGARASSRERARGRERVCAQAAPASSSPLPTAAFVREFLRNRGTTLLVGLFAARRGVARRIPDFASFGP